MEVDKEKLKLKLKKNNISISDNDLDEVINIYQFLMEIVEEISYEHNQELFDADFYNSKNSKQYFTILKCIICLYKKDLIKYVDFISMDNIYLHQENDVLGRFIKMLKERIDLYQEYKDDYMYRYYMSYIRYFVDYLTRSSTHFTWSMTIDDNYKEILSNMDAILTSDVHHEVDDEVSDTYHEDSDSLEDKINYYMGVIYYYFLGNDIINKDYERACNFLEYVDNNILNILKQLFILGIKKESFLSKDVNDIKVIFNFIDDEYKNFDKRKIVRIAK